MLVVVRLLAVSQVQPRLAYRVFRTALGVCPSAACPLGVRPII